MLMRIVYSLAPILSEIIILFNIESKLIFDHSQCLYPKADLRSNLSMNLQLIISHGIIRALACLWMLFGL